MKGEILRSISITNKGIYELYKVKYTDERVHSSAQIDDRSEGISLVMFVFLSVFPINSVTKTTGNLVTIYSTLELSDRVIIHGQTPQNLRDNAE